MHAWRGSALTKLAGLAAFAGLVACVAGLACDREPSAPSGPSARGAPGDYAAYGRYPPPSDAPPASWPSAAQAAPPPPGPAPATTLPPPSAGCGKPAPRLGVSDGRVRASAQNRGYVLSVPPSYVGTTPLPLVFVLHGGGGSAADVRAQMDLEAPARGQALFVYPQAINGNWDLDAEAAKNPDVALFDTLLFTVANTYCVDTRRVFVTGFSNGAYMANQLACRRGDKIRGVVSHAGGGPYENQGRYDEQGHLVCPGKAVAAMIVRGDADGVVQPTEGDNSVAHWRFANRCTGGKVKASPAPCEAIQACAQPVMSCRVPGLGHAMWSEGRAATWAFFDALK
jgi:polyhydroxybutyrate depolymerase